MKRTMKRVCVCNIKEKRKKTGYKWLVLTELLMPFQILNVERKENTLKMTNAHVLVPLAVQANFVFFGVPMTTRGEGRRHAA